MRLAIRLFAVVAAVFLAITLVLENIPAGADVVTSPTLAAWVDLARSSGRTSLGPFELAAPRLADAACEGDGTAFLTFESPVTGQRTLVRMDFLATTPVSARWQILSPGERQPVRTRDNCWSVPAMAVVGGASAPRGHGASCRRSSRTGATT